MTYRIRDYGAAGDGKTLDTKAIQGAIDACHKGGGGTVLVDAGRYVVGTLVLRSNIRLHLDAGAVLLSSLDMESFPSMRSDYASYIGTSESYKALLYAEAAEHIHVSGEGTIDGRCEELEIEYGFPSYRLRPRLIHFRACNKVSVRGITLRNSATWVQHYKLCTNLTISGVTVDSRGNPDIERARFATRRGLNQDGLDIDSCRNVCISDCHINSDDDGICLKSRSEQPCENVTVTNCTVSSNASGIKLGTESNGGFRNISVANCVIYDTRGSALGVTEVDGGACANVVFSNIVIDNVKGTAIFVRLNNRARPLSLSLPDLEAQHKPRSTKSQILEASATPENASESVPELGSLQNVSFSNIVATRIGGLCNDSPDDLCRSPCSISGIPGHPVRGVALDNCRFHFLGGGSPETALETVPEREGGYPAFFMFGGDLPSYGIYCRHVEDLRLSNVELRLDAQDTRVPVMLDDVRDARIAGLSADRFAVEDAVHSNNSTNVEIRE